MLTSQVSSVPNAAPHLPIEAGVRCHFLLTSLVALSWALIAPASADQTILFIRHGEKPKAGLGQLDCKGLNRALALPGLLARMYGHVDAVFAPNPARQKPDGDEGPDGAKPSYDYVRPLATAEPTAIRFGLPIHADFGFDETAKLKDALLDPAYHDATVLVVWEHHQMAKLVPELVRSFDADAGAVPKWDKHEFDAIWEVRIDWRATQPKATFARKEQGLTQLSDICPSP